jgi:hypothetical protein
MLEGQWSVRLLIRPRALDGFMERPGEAD